VDALEVVLLLLLPAASTIIGLVVTGLLADRLVVRRIMRNKDVQDVIRLFRQGKDLLSKVLEEQQREH
jgi:hypothetical protein